MVRKEVTIHETLGLTDLHPIARGRIDMAVPPYLSAF